ncbi:long-chain fatty acid--CoA ligase [Caballeronia sp. SEWSISQ10-4 2]|uniref:long-chain-fatty-acid--CoA ligase n=1 Tax=Caballeronia sp. SEWSISQ10-4 2 TaxID=2937438 RepID=UPI00264BDC97|nr:long-chain fatty acid--CoA ligase [Caballeronia sp. SEWSISQ10-4 2]MDN7179490.1 long-chain fatty acid--CoA ligase [Caballeronia sp. SEWSISQ10-4 2]
MEDLCWIKSYPSGVHWNIEIAPVPVQQLLDDSAARWPDKPALQFEGRRLSFAELLTLSSRAAKGLQRLGVGPGVHVGLHLPNTPHYVIAFFGILKAGGTVVNYSPLDAAKVLEHKIHDSRTDVLFTLDAASLYPQMAPMLETTRLKRLIVGTMAEMAEASGEAAERIAAHGSLADVRWDDRHLSFAQLLDNDGSFVPHAIADPLHALAVLQYTGGTTGLPKGAMLSHANLVAAVTQLRETMQGEPPVLADGEERILAVLPPFHIYALTVNMLFGILNAAEIIQHPRFDAAAVLADIERHKVSCFPGVPTMFTALLNHPDIGRRDLTSLKFCNSGGAPLPQEIAQRLSAITGCALIEGWGMTETTATGTYTPVRGVHKAGSCGLPLPGITIRMLDLSTPARYVPRGHTGEICIKGLNVTSGYWSNREATADMTTSDGFMRTGDVGYMDEDGYVFIVDRTKDMLLCSGYNVYPRLLEEAIYQHPDVYEAAVIGIPDAYRGQSPKAFVVLKPDAQVLTLAELQAFLKDKLGKHEMVQALEIREALPKTPVGKISKKELRDEEKTAQVSQT